jgi:hypothetical protein
MPAMQAITGDIMRNRRLAGILIAQAAIFLVASSFLSSAALAQADYPNKPIKILVPFPPGGTSDVMGRMMAEPLSRILKQPVTVENVVWWAPSGACVPLRMATRSFKLAWGKTR